MGEGGGGQKPWRRGAEVKLKEPGWEGSGGGRGGEKEGGGVCPVTKKMGDFQLAT